MSLDVQFEIDKAATLLSQQNPQCHVVVSNRGPNAVELVGPGSETGVPILRIVDPRTGIELFKKESSVAPKPEYWTLPVQKDSGYDFPLLSISGPLLPGEYDVSAIVPYQRGSQKAESKPVRIKVAPVTPRGLNWSYVQGGWAAVAYGVSVNAASDPPKLVRYAFAIKRNGGVTDVRDVAPCSLSANPVLSTPPNKVVSHTHWIGWMDEKALAFTHFGEALPPMKPVWWQPEQPEFFLVPPLAEEASDGGEGPWPGVALLWLGDAAKKISGFRTLQLGPNGKVTPAGICAVGNARPSWAQAVFRADRKKLVFYTMDEGDSSILCQLNWPEAAGGGEPRKLFTLPGACVGGVAMVMPDDSVIGANITRGAVRAGAPVSFTKWRLDTEGKFSSPKPVSLSWGYQTSINRCVARIGPGGGVAVLMSDEAGQWSLFDNSGESLPLPPDVGKSLLPRDVVFYSEGELALIVGRMTQGFEVMMSDGSPLPRR